MKLLIDGLHSYEVDSCRPWAGAACVCGDVVGGKWLSSTWSPASICVNDDMRNEFGSRLAFWLIWIYYSGSYSRPNSAKLLVA